MTAGVVALTGDGRPAEVVFRFEVPLEDPSLSWLGYRGSGGPLRSEGIARGRRPRNPNSGAPKISGEAAAMVPTREPLCVAGSEDERERIDGLVARFSGVETEVDGVTGDRIWDEGVDSPLPIAANVVIVSHGQAGRTGGL